VIDTNTSHLIFSNDKTLHLLFWSPVRCNRFLFFHITLHLLDNMIGIGISHCFNWAVGRPLDHRRNAISANPTKIRFAGQFEWNALYLMERNVPNPRSVCRSLQTSSAANILKTKFTLCRIVSNLNLRAINLLVCSVLSKRDRQSLVVFRNDPGFQWHSAQAVCGPIVPLSMQLHLYPSFDSAGRVRRPHTKKRIEEWNSFELTGNQRVKTWNLQIAPRKSKPSFIWSWRIKW
jgi:hypothetical protein